MRIWILAKKDLRLLIRDPRAVVVLLAMPFIFILVLGISLGEGFGTGTKRIWLEPMPSARTIFSQE